MNTPFDCQHSAGLRLWDSEIPAYLSRQRVRDFAVSRHSRPPVIRRITVPRVPPPFADQGASMLPQVSEEFVAFHDVMLTSS